MEVTFQIKLCQAFVNFLVPFKKGVLVS